MAASALVGLQWGDEGKGKMVDILSAEADWVVRCQGGSNAGHTVKVGSETTVLHLIPSGILTETARCVIGNGVVVDPEQLLNEIDELTSRGVDVFSRLLLSERAHLVFPYHKVQDAVQEAGRTLAIGTTGRGIGPAYEDKVARIGIRAFDLLDADRLAKKLEAVLVQKRSRLGDRFDQVPTLVEILERYLGYGERLRPIITDTVPLILDAAREGRHVFLEGAQGILLDIDLGTYPYVTSSYTVIGGLLAGAPLPPRALSRIVGVAKAYTTRVGSGPFPTELHDDLGTRLRDRGVEYGATTGRPRRCGWFDAVAVRFAVDVNGVDEIALTKVDVLSGFDEIRVCTAYRRDGYSTNHFPSDPERLEASQPEYETFPGWQEDITEVRDYHELPANLKSYISALEDLCRARVSLVSVGPRREEIVKRSP